MIVLMRARMLVEHGKDFIAEFLIEARSLETEGREGDLLTASPARFLLSSLQQFRADALPSQVLMHPYRADVTTRTPGPAFEPCIDGLLSIPQKNRQPLSVVSPCFFHVIFVETVLQKPYIFQSRLDFNVEGLGVHHTAPCFPCS